MIKLNIVWKFVGLKKTFCNLKGVRSLLILIKKPLRIRVLTKQHDSEENSMIQTLNYSAELAISQISRIVTVWSFTVTSVIVADPLYR
jgi:hypothetical protein